MIKTPLRLSASDFQHLVSGREIRVTVENKAILEPHVVAVSLCNVSFEEMAEILHYAELDLMIKTLGDS